MKHFFLLGLACVMTAATAASAVQPVETKPLTPKTFHFTLDDLPEPFATTSARKGPKRVDPPTPITLNAPPGFRINVFASGLRRPRWLALTPEGHVLVTETPRNRIRLLRDENKDGHADAVETFATAENNLQAPFGMSFDKTHFYLGNTGEVRRYAYQRGQLRLEGKGEHITQLTPWGYNQHWTRNVRIAPDGRLFVTVGSKSNVDVEPHPRASVLVMNGDGTNRRVFADGLRNPVGLDFHPITHEPYVTVNERDKLGDDLVPDYLTRIRQGEFYGWPYVYLTPKLRDPRRPENDPRIPHTKTPDVLFQSHSAALGVVFYRGKQFPPRYRNGAFVAFRGSWNRHAGTGYKIVYVPFNKDHRPTGTYEDFVTGFLIDPQGPTTFGRPVAVLILPDGSLIFTEEANGFIYRVSWVGE